MTRQPLSEEEALVFKEIEFIAGGYGLLTERSKLTTRQDEIVVGISQKGYITLTKKKFVVVIPPDPNQSTSKI